MKCLFSLVRIGEKKDVALPAWRSYAPSPPEPIGEDGDKGEMLRLWRERTLRRLEYTRERGKNRSRSVEKRNRSARHPIASISDFLQVIGLLNTSQGNH
jgi:hypothetical protein